MAEPTVRMSGIVLASLMFQHVNCDSDVEGLILGESKFEEQITISDSQADHIHIEEIYNIQKHIASHKLNDFYNSVGDVNVDAVKKLLANNKQENVIGWYRQRRNSDQQMTFREKIVHETLKTSLSNPHMIFLLLTPSRVTAAGSTHRMEYAAFISRSRQFINVPVLVSNLGLLEQLAYWKVSAPCSAAGYNATMKNHSSKFFSSNGLLREVNDVNAMNDSLQAELQRACGQVEESERLVETLQAEVSSLKRKLGEKKQNSAGKRLDGLDGLGQRNNLRLQDAIRALFAREPLFLTQTLTLEAFPVADEDADDTTTLKQSDSTDGEDSLSRLPPPGRTNCRKRPNESAPAGRERKRRKSRS
ncbi:LOW QUALITY PROTEIN: BRCA1-A complex subunit Abraxas 1 [Plectropomus leopardus]|uniref:LOW QUALITY PROTEIN: BRCA1-A complex subunit Abraxas 1 n=1 Tax=Plectropomus leopardus TaxID=160734 RepID=UPI001C4B12E2|nr:LOW QUALITY PROTEIN: BRCA1-A complex subunit Abraxas 1 [Plectropomus leopardus]